MKTTRRRFGLTMTGGGMALTSGLESAAHAAQGRGTRIKKVDVIPVGIEFRTTFNIGVGKVGGKGVPGKYVYVKATTDDGRVGWGATTTVPNWSYETVEAVVGTLEQHLAPLAIGRTPFELNALKKEMDAKIRPAVSNGAPFAKSALEIAFLDLAGQITGQPLHALLGGKVHDTIDLCYAVSIDEPEAMAAEVKRWPACWCFKVKVSGDTDKDLVRLRAISDARPDAVIWLDANQSYQPIALERFLQALPVFDKIRCFEQPVRSEDWLGLRRARDKSPYPVAIDEGCFSSFDVARMSRLDAADLVVLKVPKSGGVTNCYKSAVVSEAHGLGLLGSGLTDAGVSFMAAIHLYSTLDLLLPPELNGPQFLTSMMAGGIEQDGVTVTVPDKPGLGITVPEDQLRDNQLKLG
ncbi:MAG: mandelate racemase/muconate lactonizing enzyme family protein [Bryobacterales bacterium]|nr:mandelate racemase/muconate lactonizing enzyme family protein [Bryobacterales bacterium]MDE0295124.1 mandelate racemase/muconate lactonizing enzyme family protein [Bryobacterales bacterium]